MGTTPPGRGADSGSDSHAGSGSGSGGPGDGLGDGTGHHAFVEDIAAPVLSAEDHHHLATVLRIKAGEPLTVADGRGRWRRCHFGDPLAPVGEVCFVEAPVPPITIAFALVKGERPELIVQKLTEIGVDRIVPFLAERSVVRPASDRMSKQLIRWRRVAREAAMQSRRAWLPEVEAVRSFSEVVAEPGAIAADRGGVAPTLGRPTVLVGPEGGWSPGERSRLGETVALGPQVLRAETACIAAATLLIALRSGIVASAAAP